MGVFAGDLGALFQEDFGQGGGLQADFEELVVAEYQVVFLGFRTTSGVVSGYWLNIPGRGARCPTCNAPRPDLARQILGDMP